MRTHIGPYRIERKLKEGGMGVVYKAFHDGLNRPAAVKTFLPKKATSADMRRRLRLEAQAQARLHHPNIVAVYDLIEDDPDLFIAMEYVEGETLQEVLQARSHRAMALVEAMENFKQILDALEYVHCNGVVHRDVKPSNVMVSGGCVKLMDFGIALMAEIPHHTKAIIGTPQYMSPEQFHPSATIDHRTDIYSAALVLFEVLAGRLPFEEKGWMGMQARPLTPPDLKNLVPDLPTGVSDAVAIALRREPDHRFQTIAEFRTALIEGVSGFLPAAPDPESDATTISSPGGPEAIPDTDAKPAESETSHTTLLWIVSLTVVFFSMIASLALLLKHSAPSRPVAVPTLRASVRTETVFVPLPGPPSPTPASAPETVRATPRQPDKTRPFLNVQPTASKEDNDEQRRRLEQFRDEIARAFQRAEAFLAGENFDSVQGELDSIDEKVRQYPNDLRQERDEVRRVTNRLNDARVLVKTRVMQETMWQGRLKQIQKLSDTDRFPEAEALANDLIKDPQAPEAVASRARDLLQEAKDRFVRTFKDARTGETKNMIRKPSSPPRK